MTNITLSPHPPALSTHDSLILSHLLSTSSAPSPPLIDPALPSPYPPSVLRQESSILLPLVHTKPSPPSSEVGSTIALLSNLITQHPSNASLRNNRAQAARLIVGDDLRVRAVAESSVWEDLTRAIELVRGAGREREGKVSKAEAAVAAKALAQRAVLVGKYARTWAEARSPSHTSPGTSFHTSIDSLQLQSASPPAQQTLDAVNPIERNSRWLPHELQGLDHDAVEAFARRDLEAAGRYGDEGARDMAVRLNPYAKLCGDVVREATRGEMGGAVGEQGGRKISRLSQ
ncbi:hypothetical protein MMC07_005125 [Pseudocyphellaria aurata]|nr:hypothetical protein [Pseudocyphellaria aurata]